VHLVEQLLGDGVRVDPAAGAGGLVMVQWPSASISAIG
jgi:hypothetical protein